jgi:hypothetical protein
MAPKPSHESTFATGCGGVDRGKDSELPIVPRVESMDGLAHLRARHLRRFIERSGGFPVGFGGLPSTLDG